MTGVVLGFEVPNFRAGYAVSIGERSHTFEDRIHIVPLDRRFTPTT